MRRLLLPLFALPALAQEPFAVDLPRGLPPRFEVRVEREGVAQWLSLEQRSVRAEDFLLLAYRRDGSLETLTPPPPSTYRGVVAGEEGSLVVASLSPLGLSAHIFMPGGDDWTVEPLRGRGGAVGHLHIARDVLPEEVPCDPRTPAGAAAAPPSAPIGPDPFGNPTCIHEAEIAFDADYEYYLRQGGTVAGTVANIENHIAVVNEFYARDVQIQHRITAIVVRTAPFYFNTDGGDLLDLFQAEWNSTQVGVPRDMAHLMTDKTNLSGYAGLAYVGVVCNLPWAYGWSVDSSGVLGHELGHNWGAGHCHDTSPCNNMCGACLYIAPLTHDIIIAFRDSLGCLDIVGPYVDPVPPYAYPDGIVLTKNQLAEGPLTLDVLANDDDGNCQPFSIKAVEDPTPMGAHTSVNIFRELVYDADQPHVGVDAFTYTVGDPTGLTTPGQVTVDVPSREVEAIYALDEGTGTVAQDGSGYGHEATLQNGPTWDGSGPFGSGVAFDGIDDRVRIPPLGLRGDEVTLTAWLRRDASEPAWASILMTRAGEDGGLHFGTANELRYTWTNDSGTWSFNSGLVPPLGQWVFVALVIRPEKAVLHMIDGTTHSKKTRVASHGQVTFSGQSFLGWDPDDASRAFLGALAQVAIYDRALGSTSLEDLALLGGPPQAPLPRDGGILTGGRLSWHAPAGATDFDVYLGSDYLAVRDADTSSPLYQGTTSDSTWDPGNLTVGQRLFWRVDSHVFPTLLAGDVWQFTVGQAHRWALDETSGAVAVDDLGGVDGSFEGGVVLGEPGASAATGNSIRLDGVDDLVRIPPLDLNDNHCTISAWVKLDGSQTGSSGIVLSNDGTTTAGLFVTQGGELRVTWNGSSQTTGWSTGLNLPQGQWRFVAMVVDPDRVRAYLGDPLGNLSVAEKVISVGNDIEAFDGDTLLGEYTSSVPRALKGWLDEVTFFPTALEKGQIQALYEGSL